jgi:hypothetical protein
MVYKINLSCIGKRSALRRSVLDPNTFSEDGTTSLADIEFSGDGTLAAYAISEVVVTGVKIVIISCDQLLTRNHAN